jgi:hypothetical protein
MIAEMLANFSANTYALGTHPVAPFTSVSGQEPRLAFANLLPVSIEILSDNSVVADFGAVVAARPVVDFSSGVSGNGINLVTGYDLVSTTDHHVSTAAAATQNTNMSFTFIERDGAQEFRPFTHLAFRYLQISNPQETLAAGAVYAITEHSDAPPAWAATFSSANPTLDAVFALLQHSALFAAEQQFVDTATREKGQFLWDAINESYANMSGNMERNATRKAIREMIASEARYWTGLGRLNAVYPNGDGQRDIPDYTELFPNWVWRYFLQTGDAGLLAEAFPLMSRVAAYVRSYRDPTTGLVTYLAGGGTGSYEYGIIDWPNRFGYDTTVAARTTVNILAVDVLRTCARAAAVLGQPDTYTSDANTLVSNINNQLRDPTGLYADGLSAVFGVSTNVTSGKKTATVASATGLAKNMVVTDTMGFIHAGTVISSISGTTITMSTNATGSSAADSLSFELVSAHESQLANAYAIAFDIAPQDTTRATINSYISGLGMNLGPMTAHWLLKALAIGGSTDQVLTRLTDAATLGWARILSNAGTFTWESWTADTDGNSQSHGWGAQALVDVLETELGVSVSAPGAAMVTIQPPLLGLKQASGTVYTQRGPVTVAWSEAMDGSFSLSLTLPVNMQASIFVPVTGGQTVTARGAGAPIFVQTANGYAQYTAGSGDSELAAQ